MTPTYYLLLSALLFTIGAVGVLVRRNAIVVFMCIELMLNACNLAFVSSGWPSSPRSSAPAAPRRSTTPTC